MADVRWLVGIGNNVTTSDPELDSCDLVIAVGKTSRSKPRGYQMHKWPYVLLYKRSQTEIHLKLQ